MGPREPGELRGPEGRVEVGAGPRVHGLRVEPPAEPFGRIGAPRVAPAEHLGERLAALVEREQAVAEARRAVRLVAVEHRARKASDLRRVASVVFLLAQLAA